MPGGLMQIATYGSQDLYLTGTPEITFFKVVYRRHTNFSTESIEIQFDDNVNFGEESSLTIPRIGDLISKAYIKIVIPSMALKRVIDTERTADINTKLGEYETAVSNYHVVLDYMGVMMEAFRRGHEQYTADNTLISDELYDEIIQYFTDNTDFTTEIAAYINVIPSDNNGNLMFIEDKSNMKTVSLPYDGSTEDKSVLYKELESAVLYCETVQKYFFEQTVIKKASYLDAQSPYLKFGWVDKLGHSIIDYVEVTIGGHVIDKHYGDWLNIWHELTSNNNKKILYDKMIGDIPILTNFNRDIKPIYELYIPLQFWFCRNNGLALPLVSLEYHEVMFNVKFKDFNECCYVENDSDKGIYITGLDQTLVLGELTPDEGIYIEASMLIDYVYLDSLERRRFAQASHEYLIEQVQIREFNDVSLYKFNCLLDFNHPCKELIWVAQKIPYTENINGHTKCHWHNYGSEDNGTNNLVQNASIEFNGYERVPKMTNFYYNYLQPLMHHSKTPSDGINVYSFSFNPEEHQPSGQCNMSKIPKVVMYINFNKEVFVNAPDPDRVINFRIYAVNNNILRFMSGMAGCAYTTG